MLVQIYSLGKSQGMNNSTYQTTSGKNGPIYFLGPLTKFVKNKMIRLNILLD
jgi:hypothetical protein